MSSKRYCERCGEYLGDYMTDDFFKYLPMKYCPVCKTEIVREQKRKCERERRKKKRLERQAEKTRLELLQEENTLQKERIELLETRNQQLREEVNRSGTKPRIGVQVSAQIRKKVKR